MRKRLYRAGLAWLMAVGVALLLRWLYVVWPNTLTAVLTPVSASPWEWGKALYWPVLAALLLLRWMAADETEHPAGRAWWLAAALPLVMTGACWALGAAGESILWIWLAVLTLGLPAGFLSRGRGSALLPLTLAVLLGAAYLLFTVLPPLGGPFTDPADVSALAPIPY